MTLRGAGDNAQFMRPVVVVGFPTPVVHECNSSQLSRRSQNTPNIPKTTVKYIFASHSRIACLYRTWDNDATTEKIFRFSSISKRAITPSAQCSKCQSATQCWQFIIFSWKCGSTHYKQTRKVNWRFTHKLQVHANHKPFVRQR